MGSSYSFFYHHRILGCLLQSLLLVPSGLRSPGTVRLPGPAQRFTVRRFASSPTETRQTLQRESQSERVPQIERFKLYDPDAHRRRFMFSRRRNPVGRSHRFAHIRRFAGTARPRLRRHQRPDPIHQFLHFTVVSN